MVEICTLSVIVMEKLRNVSNVGQLFIWKYLWTLLKKSLSRGIASCYVTKLQSSIRLESLFLPRISIHMVSSGFPESWGILFHQFNAFDPFGAFPAVAIRYYQSHWSSMLSGQWLIVMFIGEQNIGFEHRAQLKIC